MFFFRGYLATNAIFFPTLGRKPQIWDVPRRWKKSKKKWQEVHTVRKKEASFQALRHFDDTYGPQFGTPTWPSIRLALLSPPKYGALINNYALAEETTECLEALGAQDFIQPAARTLAKTALEAKMVGPEGTSLDADFPTESHKEDLYHGSNTDLQDAGVPSQTDPQLKSIHDSWNAGGTGLAEETSSWQDRYIVAPGYEARMEYLMSKETLGKEPVGFGEGGLPEGFDVPRVRRPLEISPHLRCFVFSEGAGNRFPPSKLDSRGLFLQYYAMDAASALPVLAMGIEPGDVVLDMCAAPGGKTLAILQTMLTGGVVANEPESARRRRLLSVLQTYFGVERGNSDTVKVTAEDGCQWGQMEPETYDKVLVDVPCTTDRLSATSNDNSIFAVSRTKERWKLPKLQADLLSAGLQAVKPGGDVVYSTCSLSQQQNDAVVQSALYQCQTEHGVEAAVVDLSPLTRCLGHVFKFWEGGAAMLGQLVLPGVSNNFGPMYFCKLHRTR